jgi:hypothetical protein
VGEITEFVDSFRPYLDSREQFICLLLRELKERGHPLEFSMHDLMDAPGAEVSFDRLLHTVKFELHER